MWLNKHLVDFFFLFALFKYFVYLIKYAIQFTIYLFSSFSLSSLYRSVVFIYLRLLVLIGKVKRIYRKQLSQLIVVSTEKTYQGQNHVAEAWWILVTCEILTNLKIRKKKLFQTLVTASKYLV